MKSSSKNASLQDSLLLAKLNRPRLGRDLVSRPRLLSQLQAPSSLVLVVAAAGYGKTTLVSSWLETCSMPCAWLALDESDNDFTAFVTYLIAAIQTCFPSIGNRTANLFKTTVSPSITSVSHSLLNELFSIDQDYILVLDDYHLIHNSAIHKLLSDLLRHPPPSLHLVLATRVDPPLPLPALRARGFVTELRAVNLSFTLDEITSFFRDILQLNITDQDVVSVADKTEGWPVSLRLAAIHFRQSGSFSLLEASQRSGSHFVIDYLVDEVSAQLPKDIRDFLLKTSILDQLCGPLCDAIMGFGSDSGNGQKQLEWLQNTGLFTFSVENAPGWYRYHHLFRQYLLGQQERFLNHEASAALHLRASGWFDRQGLLEKAITHAFAAGDTRTAVDIFLHNRREITNSDNWLLLQQLLKLFPRDLIDRQPELRLAEASVLVFQAQYAKATAALDGVESSLAKSRLARSNRSRLEGEIAARRSAISYLSGDIAQSGVLAQSALEKLPLEWWQPREQAKLFLGVDFQIQGDLGKALEVFNNSSEPDFGPAYHARQLSSACFIYWMAADLPGIERAVLQILEKYDENKGPTEGVTWAKYFFGVLHYHHNNLDKAEYYFSPLVTNPLQVHTLCYVNSLIALALIYQQRGEVEKTHELSEALLSFSLDADNPFANQAVGALKAELALRQGNLNETGQWTDDYQMPETVRLPYFYTPPLTYVQVLLAQNTPFSRKKAARALKKLKKIFTADHQPRGLISVLSLNSLLRYAEGDEDKALVELQKAIGLAEPGGFIRLFVDLGEAVKPHLTKLMKQGVSPAYLARILSAFDAQKTQITTSKTMKAANPTALETGLELTNRELEVLQLLDKRYTDKEIAETLIISKETVHSHIAHLADKLDVHGRRAIVQAARDLGLLG
jgi:LuxR family transcriptional regulator, maltose regulon positive regulatory protein